jgi:hypothetical protein
MENCGIFTDTNCEMSSIIVMDTDSSSLMFRRDELILGQHLESISDQVIEFSNEGNIALRSFMPVLPISHTERNIVDYWQNPFFKHFKSRMAALLKDVSESHAMHDMRKSLKMDEDPWDNYLYFDSKYFMPILCHGEPFNIEEQILISGFVEQSIKEQNISEYKLKTLDLIKAFLDFANTFKNDEDEPSLTENIRKLLMVSEAL